MSAEFTAKIMGTDYTVKLCTPEEQPKFVSLDAHGLCEPYEKYLYINIDGIEDVDAFENINQYYMQVLRHEMIHAVFFECGLTDYMRDETLVEMLACIFPKITSDISWSEIELSTRLIRE